MPCAGFTIALLQAIRYWGSRLVPLPVAVFGPSAGLHSCNAYHARLCYHSPDPRCWPSQCAVCPVSRVLALRLTPMRRSTNNRLQSLSCGFLLPYASLLPCYPYRSVMPSIWALAIAMLLVWLCYAKQYVYTLTYAALCVPMHTCAQSPVCRFVLRYIGSCMPLFLRVFGLCRGHFTLCYFARCDAPKQAYYICANTHFGAAVALCLGLFGFVLR